MRLPYYASSTAQVNRNTWGSVEEFFAAFVANVPTLFTLRKDPNKEREAEAAREREAASTSSARARPRFTPNRFRDTDLLETDVQLGTVTVVEGEGSMGGGRGRGRARSRGDSGLKGQASEENLIPDGKFGGRDRGR